MYSGYEERTTTYSPSRANARDEADYQAILKGYETQLGNYQARTNNIAGGYAGMEKLIRGVGDSQRTALSRQYSQQLGAAQSSLVSRGLGNTTALDSARRGLGYDQNMANVALEDSLTRERLGVSAAKLGYLANAQQGYAGIQGASLGYQGQYRGAQQQQDAAYAGQYGLAEQGYGHQVDAYQRQLLADAVANGDSGWHSFDSMGAETRAGGGGSGASSHYNAKTPRMAEMPYGGVPQYNPGGQQYSVSEQLGGGLGGIRYDQFQSGEPSPLTGAKYNGYGAKPADSWAPQGYETSPVPAYGPVPDYGYGTAGY